MTSYDQWRCTDLIAEQQAEQDARLHALAAEIRATMTIAANISEIELDASFDDACCAAITLAFVDGTNPGIALHNYAQDWLDREALRLARERLKL